MLSSLFYGHYTSICGRISGMSAEKNLTEAQFQKQVSSWLKKHGCEVFKMTPGAGIPDSTEDLLFLVDGFWGFLECKKSKTAKHRPGQDKTVARHNEMSYSRFVWPEIWPEVQKELEEILR